MIKTAKNKQEYDRIEYFQFLNDLSINFRQCKTESLFKYFHLLFAAFYPINIENKSTLHQQQAKKQQTKTQKQKQILLKSSL